MSDLTEADVQAFLEEHDLDGSRFPWRIEPQSGQQAPDPGLSFPMPWPPEGLPDGRYLCFWFSFGRPSEDPQLNWKPAWRKVTGPMTLDELKQEAKKQ